MLIICLTVTRQFCKITNVYKLWTNLLTLTLLNDNNLRLYTYIARMKIETMSKKYYLSQNFVVRYGNTFTIGCMYSLHKHLHSGDS